MMLSGPCSSFEGSTLGDQRVLRDVTFDERTCLRGTEPPVPRRDVKRDSSS